MLRFRLGPFPVLVYPWFFISAVLLGSGLGFGWKMLAWIFVVFVSVLAHELGHALVGRLYGGRPEIRLEAFGGVTYPQLRERPGPGRQFILSLAGPVAGLVLGALCWMVVRALPPAAGTPTAFTMSQFILVSVVWAGFNLVPMLPLDGGQMMLAVLEWLRKKPSVRLASWISAAVAVVLAASVLRFWGADFIVLAWCALFAFQNIARARAATGVEPSQGDPAASLERSDVERATDEARAALSRGDFNAAIAAAEKLEEAELRKRRDCGCARESSWRAATTKPRRFWPDRASRSSRQRTRRWSLRAPTCAPAARSGPATGCAARRRREPLWARSAATLNWPHWPDFTHVVGREKN